MAIPSFKDGARALLGLKKKDDKSGDKQKDSEPTEKDVEAAVINFVGGTLDQSKKTNKRKKSFNNEEINEFQHWNAFLETDQLQQGDDEDQNNQQDIPPQIQNKNRKKRKTTTAGDNNIVDPELTNLDDTTDHEQLVRAAILDANQLAEDANVNIQDYIQPQDENDGKLHQQIDSSIIQAAQAAAALAAVSGEGAQSQDNQNRNEEQSQQTTRAGRSTEDIQATEQAAAMVAAAAAKASHWVQNQQQGKMFSKEETEAINKFIIDYCAINDMTREEICERVWSNERKKDDFWDLLHKVLPYRTRASVYKHVRRSYHVFEVRGKWTREEDLTLARLASEKDSQWKVIGKEMNRMPEDCRDRWRNYVKCGNNRAQNKWTTQEEEHLKAIIADIVADQEEHGISSPVINWTIVSEKMGGVRSRIQCRYKWNKLLKRDAVARAQSIDINDKVWLLTKIQEFRYPSDESIQWDDLAALHPKNSWTGNDFKLCYEKMRSFLREHRKKSISDICQLLLQELVHEANRHNASIGLPVVLHFGQKEKDDDVDTSPNIEVATVNAIASAAVGASIDNNEGTESYIQNESQNY